MAACGRGGISGQFSNVSDPVANDSCSGRTGSFVGDAVGAVDDDDDDEKLAVSCVIMKLLLRGSDPANAALALGSFVGDSVGDETLVSCVWLISVVTDLKPAGFQSYIQTTSRVTASKM